MQFNDDHLFLSVVSSASLNITHFATILFGNALLPPRAYRKCCYCKFIVSLVSLKVCKQVCIQSIENSIQGGQKEGKAQSIKNPVKEGIKYSETWWLALLIRSVGPTTIQIPRQDSIPPTKDGHCELLGWKKVLKNLTCK